MFLQLVAICLTAVLLVQWLQEWRARNSKLPPGPWGLPLLGHLLHLGKAPQKTLAEWAQVYGPILYVKFGSFPTVVISNAQLAKQIFSMPVTADRPEIPSFLEGTGGERGIAFTNGMQNVEQRHFALRNLRDHGMGKSMMQEKIQVDLSKFLQRVEANLGKPVTSTRLFSTHMVNSLWSIVMTDRLESTKIQQLTQIMQEKIVPMGSVISQLAFYTPWMETVTRILTLGTKSVIADRVNSFKEIYSYMAERLTEHQVTWQKGQPRDVMDAYFDKMEVTTDPTSSFHKNFHMANNFAGDLFMAGIETSGSTLEWMLKYMARHPQVQKKLQEEIDTVVGNNQTPTLAEKTKMPYADAVLHELLRIASIIPLGIQHMASADFEFQGYLIPKGTMIICNFHAVHRDPQVWDEPESFNPERWIGEQGKQLLKHFIPFSVGKRYCIGESLARDQIWLYITNIFQRYDLSFADPHQPEIQSQFGIAVSPLPFQIVFKARQDLNNN